MQPFPQFRRTAAMFIAMCASSVIRFARKSATLIDDIVELSTALPDEWHRILIAGGTRASMHLRLAAGTFGKRVDNAKYLLEVLKWCRRQYKLSRMKYPWYYMG